MFWHCRNACKTLGFSNDEKEKKWNSKSRAEIDEMHCTESKGIPRYTRLALPQS
jgi:hypothetical protein